MNKIIIFILIIGFGCKKLDPPSEEFIDREFWNDAITVANIDFISKQGNIMNFDLHVVATKNAETHHQYPNSSFFPVSLAIALRILGFDKFSRKMAEICNVRIWPINFFISAADGSSLVLTP